MVDPTSDLGEDVDEENAPRCDNCGDPIVQSPTHRVVTWVADGHAHQRNFCDVDCRTVWLDDHDVPDTV
jgi:hypothetical protein